MRKIHWKSPRVSYIEGIPQISQVGDFVVIFLFCFYTYAAYYGSLKQSQMKKYPNNYIFCSAAKPGLLIPSVICPHRITSGALRNEWCVMTDVGEGQIIKEIRLCY